MNLYLEHHRAYCDGLSRLHDLEVSWDGLGGLPLRKRALQSAMELFGQRPDLAIGAEVGLSRGGLEVGLFRSGRDLRVQICAAGTVVVSGNFPRRRPDVLISMRTVSRAGVAVLEELLPFATGGPVLDHDRPDDVTFLRPFDGFCVMRLIPGTGGVDFRLLIGRRSLIPGVYAYHDAADLPEDLYVDQPLAGGARLSDLIAGYLRELAALAVRV
jgi:hypothetical protein